LPKKKNGTPKLIRLIGILVELNKRDWISAMEIAQKFSMSLRSVYRDVSELQNMGFGIIGTTGSMGGYRLERKMFAGQTHDFDIYNNVKAELLVRLGRSTIENIISDNEQTSAPGLTEAVYSLKDRMIFDVSDWYWKDNIDGYSSLLSHSIQNRTIIEIDYKKRGSEENTHDYVKPLGMAWKTGQWYLICDSSEKGAIIRIRSNRIVRIVDTERQFEYPEMFDLNNWWKNELVEFGRGNIEVVLKVSGQPAIDEWIKMYEKPDTVKIINNGILTVKYYVDSWNWLIPTILHYGDSVIVEKPLELQKIIVDTLEAMLFQYKKSKFNNLPKGGFVNDDSRERISKSGQE
jgi:predicted DNA-binding transcriptional regulator YafY